MPNKFVKYALYGTGGIVLLFALLLAGIALFVNPNDYKPLIVKLVQEKKQRTLRIEGDIKLKLFPQLGLDLGKTSLSEHRGPQEFAAVDSVQLYVAWLPLLHKELVVHQVSVEGARAHLIRFADGTTNFDDLMSKEEQSEQVKFDIDSVKLKRSALQFDDRLAKRKLAIDDLEFQSGRIKDDTHTELRLACKLGSDNPKLAARLQLKTGLLFALKEKHYVLDGLDLSVKGDAAGLQQIDWHTQGDIDARLAPQALQLKNIESRLKAKLAANQLELTLDAPKLLLTADKAEAAKLVVDAIVQQPNAKLVARLLLPDLSGNARAFQVSAMQFSIDGEQAGSRIKGQLSSPLRGSLDAQSFSLSKLAADFDVRNPKFAQGGMKLALAGDARLDLKQQALAANLQTKLDDSTIQAKLGLRQFDHPFYTFDIGIDRLDVDRYLPPKPKTAQAEPESPIDLSALKSLRASGSIRIGSLKVANIKSSNVRLDIKADGGRIGVAPLSANLYEGSLRGSASATASTNPQIALNQQLSGVSIGPLLRDLADKDLIEGRGNVALDVVTQGATTSIMKKNLRGSADVRLADGAIKGINIASSLRRAQAQFGLGKQQAAQPAGGTEKTDFSELHASFTIRDGVAHNEDLSAKSPLLRLGGKGDINVGAGSLNYLAEATVVGSLEGQGGKELTQLKGIPVPVRISGPFDAMKYSLDTDALFKGAAKAKLEQKTQSLQQNLGNKLKGLFGK